MKTSTMMIAALAVSAIGTGIYAETAEAMKASRARVQAACSANGSTAYGTLASSGRYGCVTGSGNWIDCDSSGECAGGRGGSRARRISRSNSRALPPSRGSSHAAPRARRAR